MAVDRYLRRFVRDPLKLRSELAEFDAAISGNPALQLFDRLMTKESDMDIFLAHITGTRAFGKYISDAEGNEYESRTTPTQDYAIYDIREVSLVVSFKGCDQSCN